MIDGRKRLKMKKGKTFDLPKINLALNLMWKNLAGHKFSDEFLKKIQGPMNEYVFHDHQEIDANLFNIACNLCDMRFKYPNEFSDGFVVQCQSIIDKYFDAALETTVTADCAERAAWFLCDAKPVNSDMISSDFVKKIEKILEKYFN